jgi:hypothetical protein
MSKSTCKACIRLSLLPVLAAGALDACSSIPRPTEQLEAARAAVLQAEPAVRSEGATELALAQGKLVGAADAVQRGDYVTARILAEQAEVDARYAWTLGEAARVQRAVAGLDRSRP